MRAEISLEFKRTAPARSIAARSLIHDAGDDEDFFFSDAEQIVVVCTALDDAARRAIEIGRLVHHNRRISGASDNSALARLQRGFCDSRPAGNTNQLDAAMLEHRISAFERWFGDQTDEIINAEIVVDCLVEAAHAFGGDLLAARMGIDDERIPTGDHAHGITRDRWQRVRHRRDAADDPKRRVFNHGETVVPAKDLAAEKLDTRCLFAECLELFDLVNKATNLCFVHFHRAEFDTVVDRNSADVVDDPLAVGHRSFAQLVEGIGPPRPRLRPRS